MDALLDCASRQRWSVVVLVSVIDFSWFVRVRLCSAP